jgi:hypothetical protein
MQCSAKSTKKDNSLLGISAVCFGAQNGGGGVITKLLPSLQRKFGLTARLPSCMLENQKSIYIYIIYVAPALC